MGIKNAILFGLVLLLIPLIISADVIPEGYKGVGYCFQISNIGDYQDYTFILYPIHAMMGHRVINEGDCVDFYKLVQPKIYAMKKTEFSKVDIETEYNAEKAFFESNPNLISSNIKVRQFGLVPRHNPLHKVVDVLEITDLSDSNLEIRKSKVIYTYEDGTTEEKQYVSQEVRPEPSNKRIEKPETFYTYAGNKATKQETYTQGKKSEASGQGSEESESNSTDTNGNIEDGAYTQEAGQEIIEKSILPKWFAGIWYIAIPVIALIAMFAILLIRKFRR